MTSSGLAYVESTPQSVHRKTGLYMYIQTYNGHSSPATGQVRARNLAQSVISVWTIYQSTGYIKRIS